MTNIFTIPSDKSFVTALAEGLWKRAKQDPLALSSMRIYLPTRRACRHLRDAFLQVTDAKAALLPQMRPLGDVDEDDLDFTFEGALDDLPPAIPSLRRQMLLMRCIRQKDPDLPLEQAASLAGALASLLDQVQSEGCDPGELENLVPSDYAGHWQETLAFLEVILSVWPEVLAAEGCMDPAARRVAVLDKQVEAWQANPPDYPIIAAGSTGSHPAVGRLMAAIAALPHGEVVLPSLDLSLDEEAWQEVSETHPQFTMKTWLARSGFRRSDVQPWDAEQAALAPRVHLLREAMRPAAVTETWQGLVLTDESVHGIETITAAHHREEADIIALRLRATLEEQGKTAALITPDRALAARVGAALKRWGGEADDSAGSALDRWPLGSLLVTVLEAAVPDPSPVQMLSLLKSPLVAVGDDVFTCRRRTRLVEKTCWRGVRPKGGWEGAAHIIAEKDQDSAVWLQKINACFAQLKDKWFEAQPLSHWLDAHIVCIEQLATTEEEEGAARLWKGEVGEAAILWLDEWRSAGADMEALTGVEYAALFTALIHQVQIRPTLGQHPRLHILGPLEARLIHYDFAVLGGLNEGTWPPAPPVDPWLSRPMKKDFGLPTPERRIGLSAHDFVQLAASSNVLLTRAERVEGSPTVPSRFWLQLEAVLKAASMEPKKALQPSQPWLEWAAALDHAEAQTSVEPPAPCPPVAVRPKSLRATEISTWMRNPYAIYARHILSLEKLDEIDVEVSAADYGTVIHGALELFIKETKTDWPDDPLPHLLEKGREAFAPYEDRPQILSFWWPRFEQMAAWFVEYEKERRAREVQPANIEGSAKLPILDDAFEIRGRVDRIDTDRDGHLIVIDYKTGGVPDKKDVLSGYEPQLALMGLMARHGAFEGVAPNDVASLEYWALNERKDKDKVKAYTGSAALQMELAKVGLENLVRAFQNPDTPYEAEPKPNQSPRYNDYAHLSRMAEWGRIRKEGS